MVSTTTSAQSGGGWSRSASEVNEGAWVTVMVLHTVPYVPESIRYRMVVGPRKTLTREDWTAAGSRPWWRAARTRWRSSRSPTRLGTTKGSGYWHFTDRADLLRAVLERWVQDAHGPHQRARRSPAAATHADGCGTCSGSSAGRPNSPPPTCCSSRAPTRTSGPPSWRPRSCGSPMWSGSSARTA
jgi:hypothetical protein